jgi:hypothetical protein
MDRADCADPDGDPTVERIEEAFCTLLRDAELAQPDEIRPDPEAGQVSFVWHEQKLVVVVGADAPRTSQPV